MVKMFRYSAAAALLVAAAFSASGCDDSTGPNGPAHVTITGPEAKTSPNGSLALWVDDVVPLQATVTDRNNNPLAGQPVVWSSSNESVVTVGGEGSAHAIAVGDATITAKAGDVTATIPVTVTTVPASSVVVNSATQINVEDSTLATVTVTYANGHGVTGGEASWSSDHPEIASVTQAGWIIANAPGSAVITAATGGKTGSVHVTTTLKPIASFGFQLPGDQQYDESSGAALLSLPDTSQIWVVIRDADGKQLHNRGITFAVDSPQVLDVTQSGLVTSKGFGTGNVIVNVEGMLDSVLFRVGDAPAPAYTLELRRINGSTLEPLTVPDTVVAGRGTYAVSLVDRNGNHSLPPNLTYHFSRPYGSGGEIGLPIDTIASPVPGTLGLRLAPAVTLTTWSILGGGFGVSAGLVLQPASIVIAQGDTVTVRVAESFVLRGQMFDANGNLVNAMVGVEENWQFDNTSIVAAYRSGMVNSDVSVSATATGVGTTDVTIDVYGTKKKVTVIVTP